jgi:hypothetical protein
VNTSWLFRERERERERERVKLKVLEREEPTTSSTSVVSTEVSRLAMRVSNAILSRTCAPVGRWPWIFFLQVDFSGSTLDVRKCERYCPWLRGSSFTDGNSFLWNCLPVRNVFPVDGQVSWIHNSTVFVLISMPHIWHAEPLSACLQLRFLLRRGLTGIQVLVCTVRLTICLVQQLTPYIATPCLQHYRHGETYHSDATVKLYSAGKGCD